MMLFLKLLLAHVVAVFLLLPDKWKEEIRRLKYGSIKLYLHIALYGIAVVVSLGLAPSYWLAGLALTGSYSLITLLDAYLVKEENKRILFFITQVLQVLALLAVVYAYEPSKDALSKLATQENLATLASLLLVTVVSAEWIKVIISKWSPSTGDDESESLAKAGKYIGILERLFVFGFIASDHWEAVGFLLAAKSVFRFGDLKESKDRKLTEYILIGTLLSFGIAILIGLGYKYVVTDHLARK
jgi:hypothetical protein